MAHSHSHIAHSGVDDGHQPTAEEMNRHRKALRILVVVLIPLLIWTLAGLIAFWPGDVSDHIRKDLSLYSVPGVTYPTAKITSIAEASCAGMVGSTPGVEDQTCATIGAQLLEGPDKAQTVEVPLNDAVFSSGTKVGQKVKLLRLPIEGQPATYQFSDFDRQTPLILLALVFAVAVVAVARWRGLAALIGLAFAGFILVKFMFPALVAGSSPVLVGLIGSSAIMFVVLYAAHGFSARTTTALVGTMSGLILAAGLGYGATKWAHLTGASSEDDLVLSATAPDLRLTSVVICGIIVAGLGVLNDVTITQASAVWELADSDPSQKRLFSRAMRIGRDHIASTVYTIAFATAGAVLPILLLIVIYDRPLFEVIQTEMFAGEIIRTIVGSIGLVLAVPLTTAIGVAVVRASAVGRRGSARAGVPAGGTGPLNQSEAESAADNLGAEGAESEGALGADDGSLNGATTEGATGAKSAPKKTRLKTRRRKEAEFDDFSDLREPSDDVLKGRREP